MNKYLLTSILFLSMGVCFAQIKAKQKPVLPSEMNKAMEDAMKGMSDDEKAEMRQMMKSTMPDQGAKPNSYAVAFTDNKKMIPAKDVARINSISKKALSEADIAAHTAVLYDQLMSRMPSEEKAIVTDVLAKAPTAPDLMETALISFLQGHNYAAMGLAMKAVQADPKNINSQNNLAAILSQTGYPENAIPYLNKIAGQMPDNSTVLHNLGYAWLALGSIDSASNFFARAAARNPNNPETALCLGLIEELTGDPKKATDHYVKSFEEAPNPFAETMAKNAHAQDRLDKIDFKKIKSRIVIHEYFKKDWITVPKMEDNVEAFEKNTGIKRGYANMFADLKSKLETMIEASGIEIDALADQGAAAFYKTMTKESKKGVSMMSMPAAHVQKILMSYMYKWNEDYRKEHSALMEKISKEETEITKIGKNDQCFDFDRKNNQFLEYANPLIRAFYEKKIEEFRVWLNSLCTWSWYITGNPRNTTKTLCFAWTGEIVEMYSQSLDDQYVFAKSCVTQNGDGAEFVKTPDFPNFTCPAVVTIPLGLDELILSSDEVNFDNNHWNIKHSKTGTSENISLSFGPDKNDISEPGKYDNPYVKKGDGSIAPAGIGNEEELTPLEKILDELTPLSKIPPDDLTPLPKIPADELTPLSKIPLDKLASLDPALLDAYKKIPLTEFKKKRNAELARRLLKEMVKTKCPGELPQKKTRKIKFDAKPDEPLVPDEALQGHENEKGKPVAGKTGKSWEDVGQGTGKLTLIAWDPISESWEEVDENGRLMYDSEGKSLKGFEVGLGKLELLDVETEGLQTTIINGLTPKGEKQQAIKGLFDTKK